MSNITKIIRYWSKRLVHKASLNYFITNCSYGITFIFLIRFTTPSLQYRLNQKDLSLFILKETPSVREIPWWGGNRYPPRGCQDCSQSWTVTSPLNSPSWLSAKKVLINSPLKNKDTKKSEVAARSSIFFKRIDVILVIFEYRKNYFRVSAQLLYVILKLMS